MARPRQVDPATLAEREIAGYFAVWDAPVWIGRDGGYTEDLDRRVFDGWLASAGRDVPLSVLWQHGVTDDVNETVPIGRCRLIDVDRYGAFVRLELSGGELADRVLESARRGEVGFSYHFDDIESAWRDGHSFVTRLASVVKEISITSRPSQPKARPVAVGRPGSRRPRTLMVTDFAGWSDDELIGRARLAIESSGGNVALLERKAAEYERARQQAARDLGDQARLMARTVAAERHRARGAYLEWLAECAKRYQHPTDDTRAVLRRLADAAALHAGRAEADLREFCVNDDELVTAVLEEAGT